MTFLDPGDPAAVSDALAAGFAARHGAAPDAVAIAPGRVNLIGEHVDYNGGQCLPIALPHAAFAAVRLRADDSVTIASAQRADRFEGDLSGLGPGRLAGWAAYVGGVVWALREARVEVPGLDIVVDGRVPVGAGLSSSAALECSVAVAVCAALELPDDPAFRAATLVPACMRAEAEVAGVATGGMDQTVSLLAEHGRALLVDCTSWTTTQMPWTPDAAGLRLLVVDTGVAHALVDGGYADRRAACESATAALGVATLREVTDHAAALDRLADPLVRRRARHVLTEMERVARAVDALATADHASFGEAMTESHDSLRDDFEVSCAELDAVVETCLDQGALGARMTGGGFGGSAIALVPEDRLDETVAAITARFAKQGWRSPRFLLATASAGARSSRTRT